MGRSAKEHCRPDQKCDGGGMVSMGQPSMDTGDDEGTVGGEWLEKIFDAGVMYASAKALGEGIGGDDDG